MDGTDIVIIENDGPEIKGTNYWDHWMAQKGLVYLTWNAGAARLLIPDTMVSGVPEMVRGVGMVIMSTGLLDGDPEKPAVELLFEDHSETPMAIHFLTSQCDREDITVSPADRKKVRTISLWTRMGKAWEGVLRMRQVKELPYLKPWGEDTP